MKVIYDETVDVMNIKFIKEEEYVVAESQIMEGFIFDFDINGNVIGFEILEASKTINLLHKKVN